MNLGDEGRVIYRRDQIAAIVLGALFIFWNLGGPSLMGDEGQTGFMALQTLRFGIPVCPEDYGLGWWVEMAGLRILVIHPWLDCYLGGLGVTFIGHSAFGLRFFFGAFGAAFFPLLYSLARRYLDSRSGAVICTALAFGSAAILIYLRAARYYPPCLVLVTAALILWHDCGKKPDLKRWILLSACLFFLSMSFLPAGLVMNGLVFLALLRRPGRLWVPAPGLAAGLFFFFALKFYGANIQSVSALSWSMRVHGLIEMLVEINRHFLPAWLLLIPSVLNIRYRLFPAAFLVVYCAALLLGSWFAVRYLVPVIPVLLLLSAAGYEWLWVRRPRITLVLLLLIVFTNAGGIVIWKAADPIASRLPSLMEKLPTNQTWSDLLNRFGKLEFPFPRMIKSISDARQGPVEQVVSFLKEHARPGDGIYMMELVAVYRFYLPELHVVYSSRRAEQLGDRLRFVLPNRYRQSETELPSDLRSGLISWAENRGFHPVEINAPDIFYGNPWYEEYLFAVPHSSNQVKIWRK